jgi:hypothetical protein
MDLFHNEIISFCLRKETIKLARFKKINLLMVNLYHIWFDQAGHCSTGKHLKSSNMQDVESIPGNDTYATSS